MTIGMIRYPLPGKRNSAKGLGMAASEGIVKGMALSPTTKPKSMLAAIPKT